MSDALEVTIFGNTLNLTSKENGLEYLKEISEFVDKQIKETFEIYGDKQSREVIIILACLNIVDSLQKEYNEHKITKDTLNAFKESVTKRSEELIKKIDTAIKK